MQTVSTQFNDRASGQMRPIAGRVMISFDKTFNSGAEFFELDTSMLDGGDVLQGTGDVLQEWDRYEYTDYSNRLISMEWSRQENPVSSVVMATADVILDNHDDFFTPGAGSAIEDFILPRRPIRLSCGFKDELVQVFVGVTEKMPEVDESSKTVRFHCIDFMQTLLDRPLEQTVLYQDMRTDEILGDLLLSVGLLPSQMILDMGINVVSFAYFTRGAKLGGAIDELMVAEQGRFFMDEAGMVRFKNRQNYPTTSVWSFDGSNTLEAQTLKYDDIINVVEVNAEVRRVQPLQKTWEQAEAVLVPAGESVDIWAEFTDPVTTCIAPVYGGATSFYQTNTSEDGSGAAAGGVLLTADTLFATSYKMTFTNTSGTAAYITNVVLFATPAKVIKTIHVREQDDTSVGKYDEHVLTIDNNLIQEATDATAKAIVLLEDYKEYGNAHELTVKGNPALQVGDLIDVSLQSNGGYNITKINGKLVGASLKQVLNVKLITRRVYFTLDSSGLDGGDEIAP